MLGGLLLQLLPHFLLVVHAVLTDQLNGFVLKLQFCLFLRTETFVGLWFGATFELNWDGLNDTPAF